jgi:hypothetical protein
VRLSEDIEDLVKAFKNLIMYMNFTIEIESDFNDYFTTLCDLIKLDEKY